VHEGVIDKEATRTCKEIHGRHRGKDKRGGETYERSHVEKTPVGDLRKCKGRGKDCRKSLGTERKKIGRRMEIFVKRAFH